MELDRLDEVCVYRAEAVNGLKHGTEVEALVRVDTGVSWWRWWDRRRWFSPRTVQSSILPSGCSRRSGDGWRAGSMGASRRRSRR